MKRALLAMLLATAAGAEPAGDTAVAERLEDLRSDDAARRRAASETLAHIGDAAVEGLHGLLADRDWQTRREAARTLAAIGSSAAQPALLEAEHDVVWPVREAAARGLLRGPGLEAASQDEVWRVRSAAATAAARHDPALARKLFADKLPEVRRAAGAAMAATGNPEFRPEMVSMLVSAENSDIGLDLFAKIGGPADLVGVRPLFDSPDPALAARALRASADAGLDVEADIERYVARAQALHGMPGAQNQKLFMAHLTGIESLGPCVWPALEKRLDGVDEGTAAEFAVILSRTADKRAAPALRKLLRFKDADIRYLALSALDRVDPPGAAEVAMEMLTDAAPSVRVEAAVVLSRTEDGRAALVESWKKLDLAARRVALGALAGSAALDTRRLMQQVINSGEPWERRTAQQWFIKRSDPTFLQEIEGVFSREQDEENRCAILAALDATARQHEALFVTAASDGSMSVRLMAIREISGFHDPAFALVLRRATEDVSPMVRARALQGIEATEGLAWIETFTDALLDPDSDVRETAIRILARSPRASTLLPLAFAAGNRQRDQVRWEAVSALAAFPEGIAARLLRNRIENEDEPLIRGAAARAAARFPSSAEFLPALARAEKSPTARRELVEAAAEAGGRGAAGLLKELAGDEDPMVRAAVATGLGRAPEAADLKVLAKLAGDPESSVRVAATGAIGQVPGKDAEKALWVCASDANEAVQSAALAALARRGDRSAVARWLNKNPKSADLRADVAEALDAGGLPSDALEILGGKGELSASGLTTAGRCSSELRLWEASRLFYAKAAQAGQPNVAGWDGAVQMRALAAAEEGRPEAEGLLRSAVASSGDPNRTASDLAYLLTENLLLPDLALDLAKQAASGPAPSPEILDTLGWAQLRSGHPAEADATLSAIQDPGDPTVWFHRALAQAAHGREDAATASLREALTKLPSLAAGAHRNPLLVPLFARPELEAWK